MHHHDKIVIVASLIAIAALAVLGMI